MTLRAEVEGEGGVGWNRRDGFQEGVKIGEGREAGYQEREVTREEKREGI